MKRRRKGASDDAMRHIAALRKEMSAEKRASYDERVLAIRSVLDLVEQRKKRRLAERMGVSQPVIARLEKPLEPTWRQPSLSAFSRYAAALGLTLEVRFRPAA